VQIKHLSGNNVPEYKVQEQRRSRFILLHYGIFKVGWDWLLLVCTFYVAVTVPFNAAFVTFMTDAFSRRNSIFSDVTVELLFIIGHLPLFTPPSHAPDPAVIVCVSLYGGWSVIQQISQPAVCAFMILRPIISGTLQLPLRNVYNKRYICKTLGLVVTGCLRYP